MTMEESTVTFGNIMCLNEMNGGAVTPPSCAASVPIPSNLAKAIAEELKASSVVIKEPKTGASDLTTRPAAGRGDLCTQVSVRSPTKHFALPIVTTRRYAQLECAKSRHLISCGGGFSSVKK